MIFSPHEVIVFLISVGVLAFVLSNLRRLRATPGWPLLFAAWLSLMAGWTATIVEGLLWNPFFNALEHLCYISSNVLVLVWCLRRRAGEGPQA